MSKIVNSNDFPILYESIIVAYAVPIGNATREERSLRRAMLKICYAQQCDVKAIFKLGIIVHRKRFN